MQALMEFFSMLQEFFTVRIPELITSIGDMLSIVSLFPAPVVAAAGGCMFFFVLYVVLGRGGND